MDKRIVIFDDNIKRRESLEMLIDLSDDMICVGSFPDCSNVLNNIDKSEPDLVLMDIDMPNVNGIEGVTIIRTKYPHLKILMQTVFEDDEKLFACIRAGADGYILKKAQPQELLDAINEALEGGAPMTPSIARQVLRFVGSTENKQKSEDFKLTARETEILSLLVQGLSYKMIASRCFVSLPTVNSHVQHIYEKLQVNTAVEAVTKAIGNKIV
ncbi:MAG TPA: response regulator transcription factor [Saprospiraceae bacterium]|jgi:DNA-binding NarL/FixJ family response regulator|nr:response regulator transcription factor [Saprospiraceae bacterium]MBK7698463.1 response regulator transcription factor [Saprospiraceae bacterium]MBK8829217.1 response regulator transcription factor [Saprospiraceae bacterium]MBK9583029.1 response regulator transcription factor [Saprospiraceae bacterium]HMT71520.1 response regulator transcription factor [Saprospiraceae bacterium]